MAPNVTTYAAGRAIARYINERCCQGRDDPWRAALEHLRAVAVFSEHHFALFEDHEPRMAGYTTERPLGWVVAVENRYLIAWFPSRGLVRVDPKDWGQPGQPVALAGRNGWVAVSAKDDATFRAWLEKLEPIEPPA